LELDIDVVSPEILWQIHGLIMEYAPEVDATVRAQFAEKEQPRTVARPAPKKKNKPMNAGEQEAKIEALRTKMGQFDRQGSGSQEPVLQSKSHSTYVKYYIVNLFQLLKPTNQNLVVMSPILKKSDYHAIR
jgi:bromodomain-containing factor 1